MLNTKFRYKDAGIMFLLAFLALQAFGLILSFMPKTVSGNLLVSGALNNLVLLAVYLCYSFYTKTSPVKAGMVQVRFNYRAIAAAVLVAPLLQYSLIGVMTLFSTGLQSLGYESVNALTTVDFLEFGAGGLVGYILISGVMTGICEELIFRGCVLQALRVRLSDTKAVFLSAAVFMIFHSSPDQTIFQFFIGVALALLAVRTGSIIPGMVLHAVNNIMSVLMTAYAVTLPLPSDIGGIVGVAIIGLVVGLPLVTFIIDALCGKIKENYFVVLVQKIVVALKKKRATAATEKAVIADTEIIVQEEELSDEEGSVFDAAMEARQAKEENKFGTVFLIVGIVICAILWISQLVLGFTGGLK